MSIIDKLQKNIKSFLDSHVVDELFWLVLLLCVAVSSFSLGMRHERELFLGNNPIQIKQQEYMKALWQEYEKNKQSKAHFFASKKGTVFYPLACPSGNRIDLENRVYFETKQEAQSAGYKPSSRCF